MAAENSPYCSTHRPYIMLGETNPLRLGSGRPRINIFGHELGSGDSLGIFSHTVTHYSDGLIHRVRRWPQRLTPRNEEISSLAGGYEVIAWVNGQGIQHSHMFLRIRDALENEQYIAEVLNKLERSGNQRELRAIANFLLSGVPRLEFNSGLPIVLTNSNDQVLMAVEENKVSTQRTGSVRRDEYQTHYEIPVLAGYLDQPQRQQYCFFAGFDLLTGNWQELLSELNTGLKAFLSSPLTDESLRRVVDPFLELRLT